MTAATDGRVDGEVIAASLDDSGTFAVLYDRHAAHLYRYAYRRLGPDAAQDAVADAFLAAFARRRHYDLTQPDARPWLFGIVTREIARRLRTERARYRALARAAGGQAASEDGLADRVVTRVGADAARAPLAAALRALSVGDRDVLLLFAWGELSYAEIGAALAIPVGTVRSRLNRARRKVRQELGGSDPTELFEE